MSEMIRRWSASRKSHAFWTVVFNVCLPILFKRLEITDQVTITVLVSVNTIAGAYLGINMLAQKLGGSGE